MLLVDMECSHCGLSTTEDDLYLSLDCGELTCEGCFDEGKSKSLKEENKKLKDAAFQDVQEVDVKSLQEENKKLAAKAEKAIELHNLVSKMANEDNASLQKKIDELQKEIKEYEFESCESGVRERKVYAQAFAIQAERDKLKEENKNLKEELEEAKCSMPDLCVDCDRLFDLHSAMNKITCEEDEGLRKKYDEYFGSDNDRGDLCKQCIREELP